MSTGSKKKSGSRVSKDTLNLIIAVCAVLISAASFVATYMQSDAANRQVKAQTWPLLQLETGNYDPEAREHIITFSLQNNGVGPALVKSFVLYYQGKPVESIYKIAEDCCLTDDATENSRQVSYFTTNSPSGKIIPAGGTTELFSLLQMEQNVAVWRGIDAVRTGLKAKSCYCSLLDECFETDFVGSLLEVDACQADPQFEYKG